ncbi:MAG TPA: hypothetical protein VHW24_05315, partial [Bryobacteraceae bacterium]|nr:hypothetical protein [Bryobacteraceae bacterium]
SREHGVIERQRPPLSHAVLIERNHQQTYAIVEFFGIIQLYCNLGKTPNPIRPCAILGILDWLNQSEQFIELDPPGLIAPDEFAPYSDIGKIGDVLRVRLLAEIRRADGKGEVQTWLETAPAWRTETIAILGTVSYLVRSWLR